jgi:hypothetical protein
MESILRTVRDGEESKFRTVREGKESKFSTVTDGKQSSELSVVARSRNPVLPAMESCTNSAPVIDSEELKFLPVSGGYESKFRALTALLSVVYSALSMTIESGEIHSISDSGVFKSLHYGVKIQLCLCQALFYIFTVLYM